MNKLRVSHLVKELGMTFNTIVETELTASEYLKVANKAPRGLKKPLSKVTAVEPV